MFILELQTSDMHAALGRLLDQTRVAGIGLAAISVRALADEFRISASIDISDRDSVDRLARRVGTIVCVGTVDVRSEYELPVPGPTP
ncbi:hypothetical protein [Bradyrhizobium sp. BR 1433]|uniref:hypothetical protein n=1 Tax=Bradyrhizobium sp. BR 1433 TaxID=3447967 RepID=UPI003EE5EA89